MKTTPPAPPFLSPRPRRGHWRRYFLARAGVAAGRGLLVLGLGLALAGPVRGADACCAEHGDRAAAAPDACCRKEATAPAEALGRDSLYQLDATFVDDHGRTRSLADLRGRPVVLTMFFASCGYACPLLVGDMQSIRGRLPAASRDQAQFVLVSFDVARDTPAALAKYRAERGLDDRWVLLHGDDDAVRELAAILGVKYQQDADGMFSHSNLITILNAGGEIVHQRAGLRGGLDEAAAALAGLSASTP